MPQKPAIDFADRVMRRIAQEAPIPRLQVRRIALATGSALATAIALLLWFLPAGPAASKGPSAATQASGSARVHHREAFAISDGAIIVAEPGCQLSWRSSGKTIEVDHKIGRAFYRLDQNAAVRVKTPHATFVAEATFGVDTRPDNTIVIVHHGVISAQQPQRTVVLQTGDKRIFDKTSVREFFDDANVSSAALSSSVRGGASCDCAAEAPIFEPGVAHLRAWAEECRIEWEHIPDIDNQASVDLFAKALALENQELDLATEALVATHERHLARLSEIYRELFGALPGPELSPAEISIQVQNSAVAGEDMEVRRYIARERAELDPPRTVEEMTAFEKFLRNHVSVGDTLEEELAQRLGPVRAYELRKKNGGWPGPRGSRRGCTAATTR
jgi:hypothetical protein